MSAEPHANHEHAGPGYASPEVARQQPPENFVYEVTGLRSFSSEQRYVNYSQLHQHSVPVLDLARIVKSKQAIGRDKDKLHILLINDFLRCRGKVTRRN